MNRLERRVLSLIGEDADNPDAFSDITPVRDSINDAIQEIIAVTGGAKVDYKLSLANQTFYRLKLSQGYFGWVTDAWLVNERRRLTHTDFIQLKAEDPRWLIHNATPIKYMQVGANVIGFYPRPTGGFVDLTIVRIPKAYTSDVDRIMLREAYERSVVHYAVSEYWASRGDAQEAMTHINQYLSILGVREQYNVPAEFIRTNRTEKAPHAV